MYLLLSRGSGPTASESALARSVLRLIIVLVLHSLRLSTTHLLSWPVSFAGDPGGRASGQTLAACPKPQSSLEKERYTVCLYTYHWYAILLSSKSVNRMSLPSR